MKMRSGDDGMTASQKAMASAFRWSIDVRLNYPILRWRKGQNAIRLRPGVRDHDRLIRILSERPVSHWQCRMVRNTAGVISMAVRSQSDARIDATLGALQDILKDAPGWKAYRGGKRSGRCSA